jgi:methylenetetrahydrofolate dehydrogenase (NADP+)/methenyltetrahydrofolate cyclohydrolase
MSAKVLKTKPLVSKIHNQVAASAADFYRKVGVRAHLSVILIGNNPASEVYVEKKIKACEKLEMSGELFRFPENSSQEDIENKINQLNSDDSVHGILIQAPLPSHLDLYKLQCLLDPSKDVDGFHPQNLGALLLGKPFLTPCTPAGIVEILDWQGYDLSGKNAVVVGRSQLVGKPMFHLLLERNATVAICHSKTKDLAEWTKQADLLVAAVGRPEMIGPEMVKKGAFVVDVGINVKTPASGEKKRQLVGDVDYNALLDHAGSITPVPGGVGPMTVAVLMKNTLFAAQKIVEKKA